MESLETLCAKRTPDQADGSRQAVVTEAYSWLKTPWHHMGRVKGSGVDCAMILAEVYERAGAIERVEVEPYSQQWHLHRERELFLEIVERYAVPVHAPKMGDIVLFKIGRTFSHGGILICDGMMIHAMISIGVTLEEYTQHSDLNFREKRFYTLKNWKA